jgi:hypothetical protein
VWGHLFANFASLSRSLRGRSKSINIAGSASTWNLVILILRSAIILLGFP